MKGNTYSALIVVAMAIVTILLRSIPFLIFKSENKTPKWIKYLGDVLPQAIIGMLVVYCLRTVSFSSFPFGIPELAACAVVAGLQFWKNNSVLSIIGGTIVYMLLGQLVFPGLL